MHESEIPESFLLATLRSHGADVDGDTFVVVLDQVDPRGAVGDLLVVPEDAPGVDVVEGGLISSSVARI
jgi:hypothetical protein